MFCNGCERKVVQVDGVWQHAPSGYSYGGTYNPKGHKPKPVEITAADEAVKKLILDGAIQRGEAWVATLPEKTSKTSLKKWAKLGKIAVRTVTYSQWTNHASPDGGYSWKLDWGTPQGKNQYEILLLASENPTAWEVV